MNNKIKIVAILGALAVGIGAFGAHGLRDRLDTYAMQIYEKAVFYHIVHALGILLVACLAANKVISVDSSQRVLLLLFLGIIIFSGSLYALALTQQKWLGMVTPIGGLSFIAAWIFLALSFA